MAKDTIELTPEEIALQKAAEAKVELEAKIKTDTESGWLNPYDEGVNYEHFLKACGGKENVASYCSGKLTPDQLDFLIEDLKHFKKDFPSNIEVSNKKSK